MYGVSKPLTIQARQLRTCQVVLIKYVMWHIHHQPQPRRHVALPHEVLPSSWDSTGEPNRVSVDAKSRSVASHCSHVSTSIARLHSCKPRSMLPCPKQRCSNCTQRCLYRFSSCLWTSLAVRLHMNAVIRAALPIPYAVFPFKQV